MFKNFSNEVRRAYDAANREARSRNHEYIGTEHLLLGFVDTASPEMLTRL